MAPFIKTLTFTLREMMKKIIILSLLLLTQQAFGKGLADYSLAYDPARDASVDFKQAVFDAKNSRKLVLLEFGGDWCVWCHRLDAFIAKNPTIEKELNEVFVLLRINVSEENSNEEFLSTLPKIKGYPHFFIANGSGEIVGAQDTSKLESEKTYSPKAFTEFIEKWRKKLEDQKLDDVEK